jgi:tryptophanyl-tRNA synthetase
MLELAEKYPDAEFFMFLAIMHTFTQIHDAQTIKNNTLGLLKIYAACGIDLQRFFVYNPADIAGHAQLNRVLTCLTIMGTMERMHSYKDALAK